MENTKTIFDLSDQDVRDFLAEEFEPAEPPVVERRTEDQTFLCTLRTMWEIEPDEEYPDGLAPSDEDVELSAASVTCWDAEKPHGIDARWRAFLSGHGVNTYA